MMTEIKAKSISINDADASSATLEFVVEEHDGAFRVVVKCWNDYQRRFVTGSVVTLDENNQFQPEGRWRFTLMDDGFLTWEEVGNNPDV